MSASAALDAACRNLRRFHGDPLAPALKAKACDPQMPMAPIFLAWLHLLGTEKAGIDAARLELQNSASLPMNLREQALHGAAHLLANGQWHAASDALLAYNAAHPLDATALQWGHQIDFFTGRADRLLQRLQTAWPAWNSTMEGYASVCAMHAFALEESGHYVEAEALGRHAVAIDPQDGWAWHAVAHVMEMQGRAEAGIAWYQSGLNDWLPDGLLAVHNAWHWALFHIRLHQFDAALAVLDEHILARQSDFVLHLIDATSLLWRLRLQGVDVGNRWHWLAERWASRASDGHYAFNDLHAMMAFAAVGDAQSAGVLIQTQRAALNQTNDNAQFLLRVGHAASQAVWAHASGDHAHVVALLEPVVADSAAFGGSHAQREVLALTLQNSRPHPSPLPGGEGVSTPSPSGRKAVVSPSLSGSGVG